jgi:hypothetical protein
MSAALAREVREIQNPAFGAGLLWRFAYGYSVARKTPPEAVPLPVLFLALPFLLREESRKLIETTRTSSGLRVFVDKYHDGRSPQTDLLLALGNTIHAYRDLSLTSLRLALMHRLLFLDPGDAEVFPLSHAIPRAGMPQNLQKEWVLAERLGRWCGSVTLFELANTLRISF